MAPQEHDFYGSNVADAIANACKELAASQEELNIEVLETGSPGIFGLCRKRARIRALRKEQPAAAVSPAKTAMSPPVEVEPLAEEQEQKKKARPEKKKKPVEPRVQPEPKPRPDGKEAARGQEDMKAGETTASSEETAPYVPPSAEALAAVQGDVETMLELMGCPSTVTVELVNQNVACKVSGEHQETLTGQAGRTLDSLQYLLRKMTSRLLPDRTKLSIEVGDYRARRMEALKLQVLELAAKVREDGMTQAIPALNPSERRVVHMVLQDDKDVRSRSVGDGLFKKVLIYKPGKRKPCPRKGGKGRQNDGSSEN